jgi:HD-GYP domain-containing protein (c-di-GMP phosphodiesterase class II)
MVVCCAAILVPALVGSQRSVNLKGAALFGLLFMLAEMAPVSVPNASYSVSYVIGVAALIALGPAEAAIAASFGAFDRRLLSDRKSYGLARMLFNAAQLSMATGISGLTYHVVGGPSRHIGRGDFPGVLVALALCATVHFLANTGIVSIAIALIQQTKLREVWHSNYASMPTSQLAFSALGLLMAGLYLQAGAPALVFIILPIVVARRALVAASTMDEAYEATLRALVTAIEAKDAYTRGHAERVSALATMAARELSLPPRQLRALRIAALMHDVGKLVVSTAILTKPGKLTDAEYEHMKAHPSHGCEVIEEIDFLRSGEAIHAVRHHHERMDGRGYPDGLSGDEVPLTARIVMVADAFDSMTSTRTYRVFKSVDEAMRELRRCAATQFDPMVVGALNRAINRHGWSPTPEAVPTVEPSIAVSL